MRKFSVHLEFEQLIGLRQLRNVLTVCGSAKISFRAGRSEFLHQLHPELPSV
jgi:hypothetical protein